MRLRRIAGLALAALCTGFVMFLAASLIVTTPANAQSAVADVKPPPVVRGGAKTVLPSLIKKGVKFVPGGMAINGLVSLGMMAFEANPQWFGRTPGDYGQPEGAVQGFVNGKTGTWLNNYSHTINSDNTGQYPGIAEPYIDSSGFIVLDYTYYPSASDTSTADMFLGYTVITHCRNTANTESAYIVKDGWYSGKRGTTQRINPKIGGYCSSGHPVLTGFVAGGPGVAIDPSTYSPQWKSGSWYQVPAQFPAGSTVLHGVDQSFYWGDMGVSTATPGFDPDGAETSYTVKVDCVDKDGQPFSVFLDSKGSDGAWGIPVCMEHGGVGTGDMSITGTAPDGTKTDLGTITPDYTQYPQCDPRKVAGGCTLEVLVDGKKCVEGLWECENWTTVNETDSTRVSCAWGPYTVSKDECFLLERAYAPGGSWATEANTDGNPATRSNTDPNGNPLPEPGTSPGTSPGPSTSTKPSTGTNTNTGTGTGTATAPGSAGSVASGDTKTRNCFPTGWAAFNPVEWVLKPIRCAFEPTSDPRKMADQKLNVLKGKVPLSLVSSVESIDYNISNSGCPNWTVTIPGVMSENVVCDSSFTHAIVGQRGTLFAMISIAMVWPFIRSLWYAFFPVIKLMPAHGGLSA